ncbi:MAG: glycerol-3-phosphate acyltransferase [Chloroflexi bacterium]|nr:glycerol-3-phosphate acyltransferase [Chloroflexota bacterium]
MMWDTTSTIVIIGAYLIGAVPSAYLAARFKSGIDIRSHGSGNIGVSNLYRQGGFWLAAPVVLYDVIIKGSVPVIIASSKVLDLGLDVEVTAAFAAIMGHHWSAFAKFRGGRGMATVMGAMITLSWPLPFLYALPALFGWWRKGDSAIWWALSAIILPVWTVVLRLDIEVTWFTIAFVIAVVVKRLLSNRKMGGEADLPDIPLRQLIRNRLLYDRDISNRQEWIDRTPE